MILRRALATVFLTTVVSTGANAATFTWDAGGSNESWSTAANWVGNVAPSAATADVVIPFFRIDDSIVYQADYSVNSVKSDMGLRIWLDSSLDVKSSSYSKDFGQYYNGILSGTGDFTLTGTSTIHANDLSGNKVPLQTGTGRTINNGTLKVDQGLNLDGGRRLVNNDTLTLQGTVDLNGGKVGAAPGGGQIDNFGRLVFGTSTISPVDIKVSNATESGLATLVHNERTGTMEHLGAGKLTVAAPFVNDGTFHLGAQSMFAFNGSFAQGAGGVFDIDVYRNTDESKGNRTFASATLGGTLRLEATSPTWNILYAPKVGERFTLFTATSHQGTFAKLEGGVGFNGLSLTSSWSGTSFVVAVVPEPESYAMLLAGLGLMRTVARRRKPRQT